MRKNEIRLPTLFHIGPFFPAFVLACQCNKLLSNEVVATEYYQYFTWIACPTGIHSIYVAVATMPWVAGVFAIFGICHALRRFFQFTHGLPYLDFAGQ